MFKVYLSNKINVRNQEIEKKKRRKNLTRNNHLLVFVLLSRREAIVAYLGKY